MNTADSSARQFEYEIALVRASGFFDEGWYLATYPDVSQQPLSAIRHFMWLGWRLGRSPGPDFDLTAYVRRYGQQLKAGENPLLHYLLVGKAKGWLASATTGGYLDYVTASFAPHGAHHASKVN